MDSDKRCARGVHCPRRPYCSGHDLQIVGSSGLQAIDETASFQRHAKSLLQSPFAWASLDLFVSLEIPWLGFIAQGFICDVCVLE